MSKSSRAVKHEKWYNISTEPNPYEMDVIDLQRFAIKMQRENMKLRERMYKQSIMLNNTFRFLEVHGIDYQDTISFTNLKKSEDYYKILEDEHAYESDEKIKLYEESFQDKLDFMEFLRIWDSSNSILKQTIISKLKKENWFENKTLFIEYLESKA